MRGVRIVTTVALLAAVSCSASTTTTTDRPTTSPASEMISQVTIPGMEVAPQEARVDLTMPSFSNPAEVTNPLFPASEQHSVLLLGQVDGQEFRTEVTLLPYTRVITWDGQQIEALVSQYTAFLGGRIQEVAFDYYAQADDGSVWYLGEDVLNFDDGVIVDTHGTWIAGIDGPGAMIMPADPQVGDVYRPENIPGFVFEEVTVKETGKQVDGPFGPIGGAVEMLELHMDGATEDKTFAPGYGEFYTADAKDVEALALSADADRTDAEPPLELESIDTAATAALEALDAGDLGAARSSIRDMGGAWAAYPREEVPALIVPVLTRHMKQATKAATGGDPAEMRQSVITVAQSIQDLWLRYRPVPEVDRARFVLWLDQLQRDAALGDLAAVEGDAYALDYIRDRDLGLTGEAAVQLDAGMDALQTVLGEDQDLPAAAREAKAMEDRLTAA